MEDAEDIYRNYATDERVTKFLSWPPYMDIDRLRAFIAGQISVYTDRVYNWVIEYKGQVVGSISAVTMDERNESCELGYCLGYTFWNKGIVTEAMRHVLRYLFQEVGFHRVYAKHDVDNPASGRVMVKCGMVYEGRLRGHYRRHDGTFSDSLVYGILKDD